MTTATDGAGLLAIDDWAAENGWRLEEPDRVKAISAALLAGGQVSFRSDFPVRGPLPRGYLPGERAPRLWFTMSSAPAGEALKVLPPALWVGIGCRRGAPPEQIAAAVEAALAAGGFSPLSVAGAATIHRKRDEPGLLEYCRRMGWPLQSFSPEELAAVPGRFSASPFVREVTGVDNVCERAAVLAGGGRLAVGKTVRDGATAAIAAGEVLLRLEKKAETG